MVVSLLYCFPSGSRCLHRWLNIFVPHLVTHRTDNGSRQSSPSYNNFRNVFPSYLHFTNYCQWPHSCCWTPAVREGPVSKCQSRQHSFYHNTSCYWDKIMQPSKWDWNWCFLVIPKTRILSLGRKVLAENIFRQKTGGILMNLGGEKWGLLKKSDPLQSIFDYESPSV